VGAFEPLRAHPSFDMWSFGCIIYELVMRQKASLPPVQRILSSQLPVRAPVPLRSPLSAPAARPQLWHDNTDSNLTSERDFRALLEWSDEDKWDRLERLPSSWVRALLQRLLMRSPAARPPSMELVLRHPFFSMAGTRSSPVLTENERWHCFISHYQANAGRTCMSVKQAVMLAVPAARIWFGARSAP